jgi:catechol 2,3-dioxygenase-like lactoylglutathione lyase family enzyme
VELKRIAPIFPVADVEASLRFYERLGFATRLYDGGDYGFATRDGLELHLGLAKPGIAGTASAYVWTDDADALAEVWASAGVEVHPPVDTEWRQHEGAVVDPDGNVIRFGSPVRASQP